MWAKPLMFREYAQARLFVWGVPIVYFLIDGLQRMNKWWFSGKPAASFYLGNIDTWDFLQAYENGRLETNGRLWLLLALFVLALVQIGAERKNGTQELLFSLPYSRRQIFLNKWLLGIALLTGTLALNTLIDMIVVLFSPISHYFNLLYHLTEMGYSLLALTAIYSLMLMVGSLTGSPTSQGILSLLSLILPSSFFFLVKSFLVMQGVVAPPSGSGIAMLFHMAWYDRLSGWLSLTAYVGAAHDQLTLGKAAALLLLLMASFLAGRFIYERNQPENNGRMIGFTGGETAIQVGVAACAAMVMGLLVSGLSDYNARFYYDIGLAGGFALSMLFMRRIARLRFR